MHKCRPPEKVLIVELGQNRPETIKSYTCKENLFLALPGFPGKLRFSNDGCTTRGMCANVDVLFPDVKLDWNNRC